MKIQLKYRVLYPFLRKSVVKFRNRSLDGDAQIVKIATHNLRSYYLVYNSTHIYDKEGVICKIDDKLFLYLKGLFI